MWEFETELAQVIQRTPSIKSFRFPARVNNLRYRAGQFFYIDIKINGVEAEHHFSFSSSPTEKGYIEFTKRITQSEFSQTLDKMKPGDWARLAGPDGEFTLPRKTYKLVFLSGGIGITPLRSMSRYIADKNLDYDVVLIYSNVSLEETVFKPELDEIAARHPSIRVVYVISGPNVPPDWQGKTGYINKDMVAELVPDRAERLFYISGPPKMVLALEEQLLSLNLPLSQIRKDSFLGYE